MRILFIECRPCNLHFSLKFAQHSIGGTTACVVAARLADADPELSVLLIEGGPNNNDPNIEYPALFLANLAPTSKNSLFYVTKKSPAVGDRELVLPAGGVLGGGSSTNFMMYSRAQRSDFDSWQTPGWSADEMLPYLRKVSQYWHFISPRLSIIDRLTARDV